jgi:hypothetical protein
MFDLSSENNVFWTFPFYAKNIKLKQKATFFIWKFPYANYQDLHLAHRMT